MSNTDGINNLEVVKQKQGAWSTPPEAITSHVSRVAKKDAQIVRRILQGAWNEVYEISAGKDHYILRISRDAALIAKEKKARDQAEAVAVPVPKTFDISLQIVNGVELTFELTEFIVGPALQQVTKLSIRRSLLTHAGRLLSLLHTTTCPTYGPYPAIENGPKSLCLFRKGQISFITSSLAQISKGLQIDPSEIQDVLALAETLNIQYDESRPVLAHMDYLPRHLICSIEDKKVVGVLDFGNCRSASPFDDLANWIDGEFPLSDLLLGYSNRELVNSTDFSIRMALARLQGNFMQIPFALKFNLKDKLPLIWSRIQQQADLLRGKLV